MAEFVKRKIALVAHDAMKKQLTEWALFNADKLIGHKFYATGTTGTIIKRALEQLHPDVEWDVTILNSGPLGGDQQIGARIAYNEIDLVLFFRDPLTAQPHEPDVSALFRLCDVHNIPLATNVATAEVLIHGVERGDLAWRDIVNPKD